MSPFPADLLSMDDLDADGIAQVLEVADSFVEVGRRANPKVPALRGRTVATLFFEDSTRTRMSSRRPPNGCRPTCSPSPPAPPR